MLHLQLKKKQAEQREEHNDNNDNNDSNDNNDNNKCSPLSSSRWFPLNLFLSLLNIRLFLF